MADPVSTFFAVVGIATSTWTLSERLYKQIRGIRSVGSHMQRTAQELKLLCPVLGSLHSALVKEHEAARTGCIPVFMAENMQDLLRGCTRILQDIASLIQPFVISNGSGHARLSYFKSYVWELSKKEELLLLSRALASYKLTVNVACSSLMLLRESQTQNMVEDLHKDVLALRERVEESFTPDYPENGSHNWFNRAHTTYEPDRKRLSEYNLPLQRFLSRTGSLISQSSGRATRDSNSFISEGDLFESYEADDQEMADIETTSPSYSQHMLSEQDRELSWVLNEKLEMQIQLLKPFNYEQASNYNIPLPDTDSPTDYDAFKASLHMSEDYNPSPQEHTSIQQRLLHSKSAHFHSELPTNNSTVRQNENRAYEFPATPPQNNAHPAKPQIKPKLKLTIPSTPPHTQGHPTPVKGALHRSPAFRISPRQDRCSSPDGSRISSNSNSATSSCLSASTAVTFASSSSHNGHLSATKARSGSSSSYSSGSSRELSPYLHATKSSTGAGHLRVSSTGLLTPVGGGIGLCPDGIKGSGIGHRRTVSGYV